jgi:hypothetical protein
MRQISPKRVRVNRCCAKARNGSRPNPLHQSNPPPPRRTRAEPAGSSTRGRCCSSSLINSIATFSTPRQAVGMTGRFRRALEIRVAVLVEEQAAAAANYDELAAAECGDLDVRADAILAGIAERQQRLRGLRHLLLANGVATNTTWLPENNVGGAA